MTHVEEIEGHAPDDPGPRAATIPQATALNGALGAAARSPGLGLGLRGFRRAETLAGMLWLRIGISLGLVGVLAASSWVSVPFYPVPLTLQTLAVLVIGGLLGPVWGACTVASYLSLGLLGAPVFHSGLGGLAVILGPTGGYLVGFLPAAVVMGLFAQRFARSKGRVGFLWLWSGALLASCAIYACGLPWLGMFTGVGLARTVSLGLTPFLLGDGLKLAVAAEGIRRARGKRGTRL